jgi:hypothetical protein
MPTAPEDDELYADELETFEQLIDQITVDHYDGPLIEAHGDYFPAPKHLLDLLQELWGKLLTKHALTEAFTRLIDFGQPLTSWTSWRGPDPDDPLLNDDLHVD